MLYFYLKELLQNQKPSEICKSSRFTHGGSAVCTAKKAKHFYLTDILAKAVNLALNPR